MRSVRSKPLAADHDELFNEFLAGSDGREVSTTMAFVGMLRKMLKDSEIGKLVVPIVPDPPHLRYGIAVPHRGFIPASVQHFTSPSTSTLSSITGKPKTDKFSKRELLKPVPWLPSWRFLGSTMPPRHQHHPFLHLLLHVRLPAYRRLHLGRSRYAHSRFLPGGTAGRTTLAEKACSIKTATTV